MPRPKKDNYPLSLRIEKNVYDRLTQYCEDSGQTKTLAIERALMAYIDEYYRQQDEYYGAAEPPVRCGESHLSGLTEPLRSL